MTIRTGTWFFSLVFLCIGYYVLQGFTGRMGPWVELMDTWEHAAAIAEMARDPFAPQNPHLDLPGSTSPRFTPYILTLALASRILHIPSHVILYWAGFVILILFSYSLYKFIDSFQTGTRAPSLTLLFMIALWGEGWRYSSEYCLVSFIYYLPYPSSFAFSLSILGLFVLKQCLSRGNSKNSAAYAVISAIVFTTHQLTWSFLMLSSCILVAVENLKAKHLRLLLLAVFLSLVSGIAWPYYDLPLLIKQSLFSQLWYETTGFLYTELLWKAGPSLLLLPVPFVFLARKTFLFPAVSFLACFIVYAAGYCFDILLLDRYVFFALFFVHVCGGIFTAQALNESRKVLCIPARALVFIALLCLGYQSVKLGLELSGRYIDYGTLFTVKKYEDPVANFFPLRDKMPAGSVVVSDTITSWVLPALFNVKVVSLLHNSPLVSDNDQRLQDGALFFKKKTQRSTRTAIVKRYGISYVLLNKSPLPWDDATHAPQEIAGDLKMLGDSIHEDENVLLIKISPLL